MLCDFCFRVVSPGRGCVACITCNVVVHASCLHGAASAIERGEGSPADCGMDCGEDPRASTLRPASQHAGRNVDDGNVGAKSGGEDGSVDGFRDVSGSPSAWVCGHCTQEHLFRIQGLGECLAQLQHTVQVFFTPDPRGRLTFVQAWPTGALGCYGRCFVLFPWHIHDIMREQLCLALHEASCHSPFRLVEPGPHAK